MPATAAAPPRPVSPSPHWVARSPFSVGELADGFGAGWPPPKRLRVQARRRDLELRRAEVARLRARRRRLHGGEPPRGAKHDDTSRALDAAQSLTTTCPRCRGLVDVCVLRRLLKKQSGPTVGCAGPGCTSSFRPASYVAAQEKMAAALEGGDRLLVTCRSVAAAELLVLAPADVARAVAWARARLDPIRERCRA